jgi:hypothetical protein
MIRTNAVGLIRRCQACGHKVKVSRFLLLKQAVGRLIGAGITVAVLGLVCNWLFCSSRPKNEQGQVVSNGPAPTVSGQVPVKESPVEMEQAPSIRENAEQEATARAEAERAELDRLEQERKDKAEKLQAERNRLEREYRLAAAEYEADKKLRPARALANDAVLERAKGKQSESERLVEKARERFREIISVYPGTQAAADAQELLHGKSPPPRPALQAPEPLPSSAELQEEEQAPAGSSKSTHPPSLGDTRQEKFSGSSPKQVHVGGYTRKDGTQVRPHDRAAPGQGKPRR